MIYSDLCAFVVMLTMCVLYVSFGSSVTPNILGVYSWVVLCCQFVDVVWRYNLHGFV